MDVNEVAKAEKFLYDLDMEYKNWRAAHATVGELLELVRAATREIDALAATRARYKGEIDNLQRELDAGRAAMNKKWQDREAEIAEMEMKAVLAVKDAEANAAKAKNIADAATAVMRSTIEKKEAAEAELAKIEKKIEEAKELRAQLTRVGG